jgi:hypothetical protein
VRPRISRYLHHSSVLGVAMLLLGCGDARPQPDDPPMTPQQNNDMTQVSETYAAELDVDLDRMTRAESGLYTEDIVEGDGPRALHRLVVRWTSVRLQPPAR